MAGPFQEIASRQLDVATLCSFVDDLLGFVDVTSDVALLLVDIDVNVADEQTILVTYHRRSAYDLDVGDLPERDESLRVPCRRSALARKGAVIHRTRHRGGIRAHGRHGWRRHGGHWHVRHHFWFRRPGCTKVLCALIVSHSCHGLSKKPARVESGTVAA